MKKILLIWAILLFNVLGAWSIHYETIKVGETITLRFTGIFAPNYRTVWDFTDRSCIDLETAESSLSASYICRIRGTKAGYCNITCTEYNTKGYGSSYEIWQITVEENTPDKIYMAPSKTEVFVGNSAQIKINTDPYDAEATYTWTLSNESILTGVSKTNKYMSFIGKTPGETSVTLRSHNGKTASGSIIVYSDSPDGINLPASKTMTVGKLEEVGNLVEFVPKYSKSNITWTSGNRNIGYVSSGSGYLVANAPGETDIVATTANGKTATMRLIVKEPPFNYQSNTPAQNSTDVSVLAVPQITYSLNVKLAGNASSIKLVGGGEEYAITPYCQDKILYINHAKALKPNTQYTLTIPAGAVQNEWGTTYDGIITLNFSTGSLNKMELTPSSTSTFVEEGSKITLSANCSTAKIYYTTDGKEPTDQSTLYTGEIEIKENVLIWAKAFAEGYETAEFKHEYKISHVKCIEKYPTDKRNELYNYDSVNPYVAYSVDMYKGDEFDGIKLRKGYGYGEIVDGQVLLYANKLVFVPNEPLDMGEMYRLVIPEGALKDQYDEPNDAMAWNFTTGYFAKKISAGSRQSGLLDTEYTLFRWGKENLTYVYAYNVNDSWSGVTDFAVGREATYAVKDNALWVYGEQLCGENATNSFDYIKTPTRVFLPAYAVYAGGQSTAFTSNGGLRMMGRNDFHQINETDNTLLTSSKLVGLQNVKEVVPSLTATFALTEDGNLYGWGHNANGWFLTGDETDVNTPQLIMENIKTFSASKWSSNIVAAVSDEGKLYVWGSEPKCMLDDVKEVAVGNNTIAAIKKDGTLWMWGENLHGEMANMVSADYVDAPQQIMSDVTQVDMGDHHVMVIKDDGSVWSWGCDAYAQLGRHADADPTPFTHVDDCTPKMVMAGRERSELESIEISLQNMTVGVDETSIIIAKPQPLNAYYSKWHWSSSNTDIVNVSERGVVNPVSDGTAIITISSDKGVYAQCTVKVQSSTGIVEVKTEKVPFNIYNLQGQLVKTNAYDTKGIPSGIYIINGEKIRISK